MTRPGLTHRQRGVLFAMKRHPSDVIRSFTHPAELIRDLVYLQGKSFEEAGASLPIPVSGAVAWRWLRDFEAEHVNGHAPAEAPAAEGAAAMGVAR